jgi:hypothetical protein
MQLLVYISPLNPSCRELEAVMDAAGPDIGREHLASPEALLERLRRPRGRRTVCIMAPSSRRELQVLVNHRHLLKDVPTVLVLPDDDDMAADGHLLRPRFVSRDDSGFDKAAVVAGRLIRRCMAETARPMVHAWSGSYN